MYGHDLLFHLDNHCWNTSRKIAAHSKRRAQERLQTDQRPRRRENRWSREAFWKIRQTVEPTWWQYIVGYYYGLGAAPSKRPPWQKGGLPNRWERLRVAGNGLESIHRLGPQARVLMMPNCPPRLPWALISLSRRVTKPTGPTTNMFIFVLDRRPNTSNSSSS